MVVLRSGSESSGCSSSSILKSLRSRDVRVSDNPRRSRDANSCHSRSVGLKWTVRNKNEPDPSMEYVAQALNVYNQHSVQQYELVKTGSVTPVYMPVSNCFLYHIDFTAKNTDVADAPNEKFFAELTSTPTIGVYCVKHCVSLGPINSLSGDRLNGCQYCRDYNNVWHPKGGGFVRGADIIYKTLKDICGIAILDEAKQLPMFEQVDDASPYATEVVKFINQRTNKNYKLVNPGFGTRVILPTCLLFHVNFKAKETDPTAPEKLFFAELTITFSGDFSFKHWTVLDVVDIKSGNVAGDKTNGCYYCHKFNKVRHPLMGGFVRGGDSLYLSEEEFEC